MAAGYDTTTLLGVKEIQPKFTGLFMAMFFPEVVTFKTKEVAFDKIRKGVRLAPFVAPMVSGKARRERGGQTTTFEPAYVKPTDVVMPGRLLKRRRGEQLNGSLSPAERHDAVVGEILMDHEQEIVHREEWMCSRGVLTGQVVVEGEGYDEPMVIDYGRSAENQITLVGAAKWDTVDPETYDPTDDIEDWAANTTGSTGVIVMDKLAWRLFSKFKAVKEKLDTRRGSTSQLELGPQVEAQVMRKGFFGEYEIIVYTGQFEDSAGKENFMPNYTVLIAPAVSDNVMAYGGIQDAKANAEGIVEATRYPSNWFTDNPSVEWVQTQSAPLPVIFDADAFAVITVA